jgi:hypothetical protein
LASGCDLREVIREGFRLAVVEDLMGVSGSTPKELAAALEPLTSQFAPAPLLMRELEQGKYGGIAGARRLRGAQLAEVKSVRVRAAKYRL